MMEPCVHDLLWLCDFLNLWLLLNFFRQPSNNNSTRILNERIWAEIITGASTFRWLYFCTSRLIKYTRVCLPSRKWPIEYGNSTMLFVQVAFPAFLNGRDIYFNILKSTYKTEPTYDASSNESTEQHRKRSWSLTSIHSLPLAPLPVLLSAFFFVLAHYLVSSLTHYTHTRYHVSGAREAALLAFWLQFLDVVFTVWNMRMPVFRNGVTLGSWALFVLISDL